MMATKVYESDNVELMDGTELYITPLKIKYLRDFMDKFDILRTSPENDSLDALIECVRVAMRQYYPKIKTIEDVEDSIDLKTLYKIVYIASGIDLDPENKKEEVVEQQASSENSWDNFDLLKLEAEVFLLGIWKNFEELEESMSLPEITALLDVKRELEHTERKFSAAIQGVDIDGGEEKPDEWEAMKARVASNGQTTNPNDILSFQGIKAQQAGFGIGMGLEYEKVG